MDTTQNNPGQLFVEIDDEMQSVQKNCKTCTEILAILDSGNNDFIGLVYGGGEVGRCQVGGIEEEQLRELPLTLRKSRKYSCCQHKDQITKTLTCFKYEQDPQQNFLKQSQQQTPSQSNESIKTPSCPQQHEQFSFDNVFVEKELKHKKNTNVPKFIARIFMKYFGEFVGRDEVGLVRHHGRVCQELMGRVSNNFCISDLISLLRNDDDDRIRMRNQQILWNIIQKKFQTELTQNKYIKRNKKSYMMALKVYSLRCRSKLLTERVQLL